MSGIKHIKQILISQSHDKTSKLFELWQKPNRDNNEFVTFAQLQVFIRTIDRYDVYEDSFLHFK